MAPLRASPVALALVALAALPAFPLPAPATAPPVPAWFAGDWHVHTGDSHDACDPANITEFVTELDPEACGDGPHTLSGDPSTRMREAESRGLDFVRITDHNTLSGPRKAAAGYHGPVVLVPGYEHSLPGGHAGISTLDLLTRGRFSTPPPTGDGFNDLMDAVHEAPGGLFVVNHPTDGSGQGWTRPGFDWDQVDAFEVWNLHWLYRDDVFQGFVDTSDNDEALDMWTALLDAGHQIPIVGGSDSHWLATSAVQGIGQPTTWVLARDGTPAEIVRAVKAGRTYVAWDFHAPTLDFVAWTEDGPAQIGDEVPTGVITFVTHVTGAGADRVRFNSCQGVLAEFPATDLGDREVHLLVGDPCWVRVEVVTIDDELGPDHLLYRAITSPIYVR